VLFLACQDADLNVKFAKFSQALLGSSYAAPSRPHAPTLQLLGSPLLYFVSQISVQYVSYRDKCVRTMHISISYLWNLVHAK